MGKVASSTASGFYKPWIRTLRRIIYLSWRYGWKKRPRNGWVSWGPSESIFFEWWHTYDLQVIFKSKYDKTPLKILKGQWFLPVCAGDFLAHFLIWQILWSDDCFQFPSEIFRWNQKHDRPWTQKAATGSWLQYQKHPKKIPTPWTLAYPSWKMKEFL